MYESLKRASPIRSLCLAGAAGALVFLMTLFSKVPIPLGYAHLGDAVIFLIALYLPRRAACGAAAVGSALADLVGGFPVWVIPTFFIKCGMAYIVSRLANGKRRSCGLPVIVGFILSSLWLVVGYTAAGALLYGSLSVGLSSVPGLLMEGTVNTAAALVVASILPGRGKRNGC